MPHKSTIGINFDTTFYNCNLILPLCSILQFIVDDRIKLFLGSDYDQKYENIHWIEGLASQKLGSKFMFVHILKPTNF